VILALTRVCVAFEMPTRQVLLYELVGRASLMNAIALNSGMFNASRVVGPALAGQLLASVGAAACFALNGASFLAAIAALMMIRPRPRPRVPEGERSGLSALLGGLAFVRRDRRVGLLYTLMILFGIIAMGYSALLPAYARVVVSTGAVGYSVLLASAGLGATAGALVVASVGGLRRKERLVLGGMATCALALGAAGLIPPGVAEAGLDRAVLPAAAACLFVIGFGAILFYSSTQTLIQTAVPDHLRGRIMGLWMIAFSSSVPLGALWAGWAAGRFGVAPILQVSAILCLVMVLAVRLSGVLIEPESSEPAAEAR
jgi:MFS family permease